MHTHTQTDTHAHTNRNTHTHAWIQIVVVQYRTKVKKRALPYYSIFIHVRYSYCYSSYTTVYRQFRENYWRVVQHSTEDKCGRTTIKTILLGPRLQQQLLLANMSFMHADEYKCV